MNAYATYSLHKTTLNGRPGWRGIVDIESDRGWLGVATVFGFTSEQIQIAAYMEAERRAAAHGCVLQSLRRETSPVR